MKKVTIGKLEYNLIENKFDIGDERFIIFKQHLLQIFENIDNPMFTVTYSKIISAYNGGQHADGIIELTNFKKALELKGLNYDAYSICFALLLMKKGEEQKDFGTNEQLEKLKEMRAEGVTRGFVEETVENFINASPNQFAVYLAMRELTKLHLREEFLKEFSS